MIDQGYKGFENDVQTSAFFIAASTHVRDVDGPPDLASPVTRVHSASSLSTHSYIFSLSRTIFSQVVSQNPTVNVCTFHSFCPKKSNHGGLFNSGAIQQPSARV